jgi:hypothetical protein
MPLPKREQEESKVDFLDRCMSNTVMKSEYPDSIQRLAVCNALNRKESYQKFESYNDYPKAVSNNAKRGIELNEKEGNKCATQVGKVRAQQLANGEPLSVFTIKRMYSYLSRAKTYYETGTPSDCGYISYLLWGGLAGLRWSESKLKELGL